MVSLILVSGSQIKQVSNGRGPLSLCFYSVAKGGPYCFLTQVLHQLSFYFLPKPDEVAAVSLPLVPGNTSLVCGLARHHRFHSFDLQLDFPENSFFTGIDLVQWNQWAFPLAFTERSSLRGWTVPLAFSTLGWRWKHPDLSSCSPLKDPQWKSLRFLSGSFKCDERSVALQWLAMLRVWGESSTCVSCVLPCFPFPKTPRLYKKGSHTFLVSLEPHFLVILPCP